MTAIPAPQAMTGAIVVATPFERTLLRAASAVDEFVAARLSRRGAGPYRRAVLAQSSAVAFRREAEAHGAIGLLPR